MSNSNPTKNSGVNPGARADLVCRFTYVSNYNYLHNLCNLLHIPELTLKLYVFIHFYASYSPYRIYQNGIRSINSKGKNRKFE